MSRIAALALFACSLASPAVAQEAATALPSPAEAANNFTVAGGIAWIPDYEGSNDYKLIPAAAIRGTVAGIGLTTRATWLYADFFPRTDAKVDFDAGPILGVRLNRTSKVKDDIVDLLPERKTAFELGAFGGISVHGLTNPYDSLSFRLDVLKDVGNAHKSIVWSPNVEFSTPLSRFTYASASVGAEFVGNKYADYYYGITPADAVLSGLPAYNPDGGMKSWKAGLLLNQSITGDLTGGFSIFGTANYSRLVGDFKDAPLVKTRGSASQWLLATGVAYTF